ncbi:hypothetical protein [Demequina muriae]|uniref:Uncharacterized protein n=1 Tax=Demequina muriae TaxID=3051664 RepID=A0ABT8GGI6_9MICO|nr:hypothetical protein [Demequina sp. EGI L300058]MDN4480379.1 hypothetical protein [Demequina sp. EGI L300058]
MRSPSHGVRIAALVATGVLLIVGVWALVAHLMLRATIAVERELAQPFLAIGDDVHLDEHYGTLFADTLGARLGSVHVIYESDDSDAVVEQIHEVMQAEGWDQSSPDASEWHSGGGDLGHRWGMIRIDDDEVRLFIGVIEG